MAAPKRPTHIVNHGRLYLSVNGKLEHIKKGSQLTLTEKQAKGLGVRVTSLSGKPSIELNSDASKSE